MLVKAACLECREVSERHTALNIMKWIKEVANAFDLTFDQLLALSIDSARNVTKAVDDLVGELSSCDHDLVNNAEEDLNSEIFVSANDVEIAQISTLDAEEYGEEEVSQDNEVATFRVHCVVHKLQLGVNDFLYKDSTSIIVVSQKLAAKLRS